MDPTCYPLSIRHTSRLCSRITLKPTDSEYWNISDDMKTSIIIYVALNLTADSPIGMSVIIPSKNTIIPFYSVREWTFQLKYVLFNKLNVSLNATATKKLEKKVFVLSVKKNSLK